MVIEFHRADAHLWAMTLTRFIPAVFAASVALAGPATAACMAEYKAKSDNPLKLVYDIVPVEGPCTVASAESQLQTVLASQGLTLLKVLTVTQQ